MELKIVATIEAKAQYRDKLIEIIYTLVDKTRKEDGNISYELHQDVKNQLKFIIIEVWKDQQAIDAHNASDHFKAFVSGIEGKVDSLTVDVIKPIY